MSEAVNLLNNVRKLDKSVAQNGYSKVVLSLGQDDEGNEIAYTAGFDGGAVLYLSNPWGTQQMAQDILERIQGWQYQPYSAEGALLDPAAELGDGVTIDDTYSGIFRQDINFTDYLIPSQISAPLTQEIQHEFVGAAENPTDRVFSRVMKSVNSRITNTAAELASEVSARTLAEEELSSRILQNATEISAKVSKQSPSGQTSFGWSLQDNKWTVFNGNKTILEATASGLKITGVITATEGGSIGGFDIKRDYLSYGGLTWGGSASSGVYIGQSGIQLGRNFQVDTSGNITANDATLTGTLTVGGQSISASVLQSGAQSAYSNGGYWSGGAAGGYEYKSMINGRNRYEGYIDAYGLGWWDGRWWNEVRPITVVTGVNFATQSVTTQRVLGLG